MGNGNKISVVGKKVSKNEADDLDILYWANSTWQERLAETERLRRMIWTHLLGYYPTKIEKVGRVIKKNKAEEA